MSWILWSGYIVGVIVSFPFAVRGALWLVDAEDAFGYATAALVGVSVASMWPVMVAAVVLFFILADVGRRFAASDKERVS